MGLSRVRRRLSGDGIETRTGMRVEMEGHGLFYDVYVIPLGLVASLFSSSW